MPDDHSDLVPLLPIPNRTVKRVSADDSADPRVKVGHRQAITAEKTPPIPVGFFFARVCALCVILGCAYAVFLFSNQASHPTMLACFNRLKK